jgi:hypothetical protein
MRWVVVVVCAVLLGGCAGDTGEWTSFPADVPDDAYAARAHINGEDRVFVHGMHDWGIREGSYGLGISKQGYGHTEPTWIGLHMTGSVMDSVWFDGELHSASDNCTATVEYSRYEIDCAPAVSGWVQTGLVRELR